VTVPASGSESESESGSGSASVSAPVSASASASAERAGEAMAHLQRATLEFIEAARGILDLAEEAVREPGGVASIVTETVSALVGVVGAAAPGWVGRAQQGAGAGPMRTPDVVVPDEGTAGEPAPGVEHIKIT